MTDLIPGRGNIWPVGTNAPLKRMKYVYKYMVTRVSLRKIGNTPPCSGYMFFNVYTRTLETSFEHNSITVFFSPQPPVVALQKHN